MTADTPENTPIKSTKSRFLSYFENIERINATLTISFVAICFVCGILIWSLIVIGLRPKPIYYVPGANSAGFSIPNEIPKGSVIGFATSWLLNLTNFTPETIDVVYDRAKKFMTPGFLSKTRGIMDKESIEVKESSISSVFSVSQDPVFSQEEDSLVITLLGQHNLFMGKTTIKSSSIKYVIYINKTSPTDINPYGLLIKDIYKEEISKEIKL